MNAPQTILGIGLLCGLLLASSFTLLFMLGIAERRRKLEREKLFIESLTPIELQKYIKYTHGERLESFK